MRKPLSDMTLEELWALFPIVLREHDPRYAGWFEEEAKNIRRCAGDASLFRLSQIGSSAVPGLLAKPIVDILLEVGGDFCGLSDRLQRDGWVFMAQTETPAGPKLSFNKGYTPEGFAQRVFHLHVRRPGDWGELYFRDYLREKADVAAAYGRLKQELCKAYEHDRDGYTAAKTEFVERYTAEARNCYPGRYQP